MLKRQRFTFLAIGGLGLMAAVGPGLAANLTVPTDAPAAGQGAVEIAGFTVTNINWAINDAGYVTSVTFDIARDVADKQAVAAAEDEKSGDAIIRTRLEATDDASTEWVSCAATSETASGAVTCTFDPSDSDEQMAAADLATVNIIAFDRN